MVSFSLPVLFVDSYVKQLIAVLLCWSIEDPLVQSIANELLNDKEAHDATAREWTRKYAMTDKKEKKKEASKEE